MPAVNPFRVKAGAAADATNVCVPPALVSETPVAGDELVTVARLLMSLPPMESADDKMVVGGTVKEKLAKWLMSLNVKVAAGNDIGVVNPVASRVS